MAITGMTGAVYVSDVNTAPVSFSSEPCTGDASYKRYQIDDLNLRYWEPSVPVLVEVDGSVITSGFTLEHAGGYVVFNSALDSESTVEVSGSYLTLVPAGGFFNWSIDTDGEDAEATTFASQGWKDFVRTINGWSGSAEAYWGDTQFYDSLGETVVVKLFTDSGPAQDCLEGFAIINGDSIEDPVDGLVEESIEFIGTGRLYLRF